MRNQCFVLSIIVVTLFGLSSTAHGSIRDQGQIFGTGGALELGTDEWSQSITTGISGQLTEIMIQFHYGVPAKPPALKLSIFDGGNPISGLALFSEQLFITSTDLDLQNLFTWDLDGAGLFFNVGDVFSFVLQADGVGYNIAGNDPPGYVGGELFKNGMPSTELSDIAFITYVDPVTLPTVPGFEVQTYTTVSGPVNLSFDPSGILYAGNGNDPSKIYRIDVGGSPVRGYGNDPLFDPDAVAFDVSGAVSGHPGSVLVGGIDGPGSPTGYLAAILPDESIKSIFGPTSGLINPQDILFDNEGRLLLGDAFAGTVFSTSDGDTLNSLFPETLANELAVDVDGNIYTGTPSGITIHSSDGSLLDDSFVTELDIVGMDFGPVSPPWNGHLFSTSRDGNLFRIDDLGTVTKIGSGFGSPPNAQDVAFGPDGAMYVSDFENNVIYRIIAKTLIKINEFVTFEPDPSTFDFNPDVTDCQSGAVGKFTFDATLKNTSKKELSDLLVEVNELAINNLLLTDIGLIGEGGRFEVPKIDDYADGTLVPDENVDVPFTVCLNNTDPFRFFVDVYGTTDDINLNKDLKAFYPFNGNTNDESGNSYDGIIHGDTSLCKDRFGNSDSAYYFDGDGDYIQIGQEPDIPSWDNYSVSLWFLNDGLGDPSCGFGVGYGEKILDKTVWYHDFMIAVCPDKPDPTSPKIGFLKFVTYEDSYDEIRDTSREYRDNMWHHVVVKKVGTDGEMWVDGNLVGTSNTVKTVYSWGDLLIGYSTSGDFYQRKFWSGKIDDIRIYNRALSEAEIKALFNLGE